MPNFKYLFEILDLICRFSGDSGGAVRLGIVFYVKRIWNYGEIRSWGRLMMVLGFRKHLLSISDIIGRNYSISLR